jgi:predicted RNA-binding protein with PIN domain
VEAALTVAQDGLSRSPPVPPPAGVRRYLGFTKLSTAAVQAVTRVLDRDEAFRFQVAAAVDEKAVGRAAWLWLNRPDGWSEEFAALEAEATARADTASDEREERDARRRLAATRAAAEKATAVATARAQEAADVRADLVGEQANRRRLEAQVTALEAELQEARDERARAVRQLKRTEATLARRTSEAKAAASRLRDLQHGDAGPAEATDAPLDAVDLVEVRRVLSAAAHTVDELARTLHRLTTLVEAAERAARSRGRPDSDGDRGGADSAAGTSETYRRPPAELSAPQRQPLTLPGGMLDDAPEAVDVLLRAPGVWLLVDGYNVSMVGWPDLSVAEQRRRLVAALGETAARTGASVKVVFDGAAPEPWPVPQSARHLVSVMFSPADVEADDVLLDLVARLPPARPVVVASSDNRVRDGARRLGANLVHARQLLAVVRR